MSTQWDKVKDKVATKLSDDGIRRYNFSHGWNRNNFRVQLTNRSMQSSRIFRKSRVTVLLPAFPKREIRLIRCGYLELTSVQTV